MRFHLVTDNVTAGESCNPSAYQTCEHNEKPHPASGAQTENNHRILLPDLVAAVSVNEPAPNIPAG